MDKITRQETETSREMSMVSPDFPRCGSACRFEREMESPDKNMALVFYDPATLLCPREKHAGRIRLNRRILW